MKKIILDLCGGTGAWSAPYREAGYDVMVITLPDYNILNTEFREDGIFFPTPLKLQRHIHYQEIYGIIAAPPCTMFSFARTNAKTRRNLREGMEIINACLNLIHEAQYRIVSDQQKYPPLKFWALENPYYAMTRWFLGKPAFIFDPWEFGHNYKKKTALWGHFNEPVKTVKVVTDVMSEEDLAKSKTNSRKLPKFDMLTMKEIKAMKNMAGSNNQLDYWKNAKTRQAMRAITPRGFAEAFYRANS